ncbi:group III truncated hemoglobin [Flavobacterium sp. HSC-61S13]|uniref:group III truncated hemoglobin n=1 Tax=Flavobacterium sp. HSC-61S13 TaxID=2910963 RepID=UPI0020A011F5|nr:group III truncated hemoglobin [Flavobacterium sp. HSC-61S13]MCP1996214.1 hemoglobin [Flavobacterium sp. HSC-61S13]
MTPIEKQLPDVTDRNQLFFIVSTFYDAVRQDAELGPIFNDIITEWDEHLEKITDFWAMHLFGTKAYTGNPVLAHQLVDQQQQESITPHHFGTWLFYWLQTINTHFEGPNAEILKDKSRKMQTILYMKIFEYRKKKKQ